MWGPWGIKRGWDLEQRWGDSLGKKRHTSFSENGNILGKKKKKKKNWKNTCLRILNFCVKNSIKKPCDFFVKYLMYTKVKHNFLRNNLIHKSRWCTYCRSSPLGKKNLNYIYLKPFAILHFESITKKLLKKEWESNIKGIPSHFTPLFSNYCIWKYK